VQNTAALVIDHQFLIVLVTEGYSTPRTVQNRKRATTGGRRRASCATDSGCAQIIRTASALCDHDEAHADNNGRSIIVVTNNAVQPTPNGAFESVAKPPPQGIPVPLRRTLVITSPLPSSNVPLSNGIHYPHKKRSSVQDLSLISALSLMTDTGDRQSDVDTVDRPRRMCDLWLIVCHVLVKIDCRASEWIRSAIPWVIQLDDPLNR
jgi:hypothetical protein